MTYDEIIEGMKQGAEIIYQGRRVAGSAIEQFARNNVKNLCLSESVLDDLKRELKHWDMNLHKWKK